MIEGTVDCASVRPLSSVGALAVYVGCSIAYRLLIFSLTFFVASLARLTSAFLFFGQRRLPAKFVCVTAGTVWNSVASRKGWFVPFNLAVSGFHTAKT